MTISVNDGAFTTSRTFLVTTNKPPVLGGVVSPINYTENATLILAGGGT